MLGPLSCRNSDQLQGLGCRVDADCGEPVEARRCEPQTGECYCRTDAACASREFCNPAGFCQDRSGCVSNADCNDPGLFCETGSGTCLPLGRCSSDLHCPLGQVCDASKSLCVDGCRTNGDCPGSSCRCGDQPCNCTATTPSELARCPIGTCDPTFCADETFCRFGEKCGPVADAGTPLNQCFSDYDPVRKPYCDNCVSGGGLETCGRGANYCIIDTQNPGNYFCGVDCSQGQTCPRGYGCNDVIVVYTRWRCTEQDPTCPADPNLPCTTDDNCPRGGTCRKAAGQANGFCAPGCQIREGSSEGFCACQVDSDCAQDACNLATQECSVSERPCVNDSDCRPIRCVDFRGAGGCLIGQNCTPTNGLSCLQVQ